MVQSSIATKSQSFELVRGEIDHTIKQAEKSLERFQENRESGEDLQNCVDGLNQLRGIFTLVELRGGTLLCLEAVTLANEVPVGATDDKNNLLTALTNALFILRRYVEYYHDKSIDQPELLLPVLNDIREARGDKPYPDACFMECDPTRIRHCCTHLDLQPLEISDENDFDAHARRYRRMYQTGLLAVIQERDLNVARRLLAGAAEGFSRLSREQPLGQFWCLLALVMNTMQQQKLGFERNRKRLFMKMERYAREMVRLGTVAMNKSAPDSVLKELVHILWRSGSNNRSVHSVLAECGLEPSHLTEQQLERERRRFYGPDAEVLRALGGAMLEELNDLKDRIDMMERGIDPEGAELNRLGDAFLRLGNILLVVELPQLSALARREATRLQDWEKRKHVPTESDLYLVADAILSLEATARHFITHGITDDTDEIASNVHLDEGSLYLLEARIVVLDEARSALTLAKRAITAYVESDYDPLHMANVPSTLISVWGGMKMLENEPAARVLLTISGSIQRYFVDQSKKPEKAVLEALADSLTSLEYYIDSIGPKEEPNTKLLQLAESSLKDAGLA